MGPALIVIVILAVMWVLSNVIRAQQDVAQQNARREAGRNNSGNKPVERHTSGDIESFLQEIERLRRKGQDDKGKPLPPAPSLSQPKPQPERPAKRPRPQQRRQGGDPPRRPAPEQPRPRARVERPAPPPAPPIVPELLESAPPRPKQEENSQITQQGFAIPKPGQAAPESPTTSSTSAPVVTKLKPLSPITYTAADQLLQALLRSRQGPAVAVLLQEIFGEPKCRKKPGGK